MQICLSIHPPRCACVCVYVDLLIVLLALISVSLCMSKMCMRVRGYVQACAHANQDNCPNICLVFMFVRVSRRVSLSLSVSAALCFAQ